MNTEEFLDILQQRELVPEAVLDGLRAKLQDNHRITSKSILKFLVKQEVISHPQAKQLLNTTLTVTSNAESSILGTEWAPPRSPTEDSHLDSMSLDDIPTLSPIEPIDSESAIEDLREPSAPTPVPQVSQDFLFDAPPQPNTSPPTTTPNTFSVRDVTENKEESEQKGKKKKRRKKKNEWDSPLLLVGGLGLFVLLLTGVIVGYLLNRENADTILAEARDFLDSGSYTQAIKQYERFVEGFPNHPQYSSAKIQLGMTRLWSATQGSSQFPAALRMAQQVLDELKNEPAFRDAQEDLAALLPDIAQGLAKQAEQSKSQEEANRLISQTEAALSLCANTKYIPEQYRDEIILAEIEKTLDQVRRSQEQQGLLMKSLANIQQAIDRQQTAEAYLIHHTLLRDAPGLIGNKELSDKLRDISAAEQMVIQYVEEVKDAEYSERPSIVVASLALADRDGPLFDKLSGTVAVRVDGTVYCLNAVDGSLLWHRHVGFAPGMSPQTLANGDILIVDAQQNELLRLNGKTGTLVWRQSFNSPITIPTIDNGRLFVAESSGKLHNLDLTSGNRVGYFQFGQSLFVPVTMSSDGSRIYVAGEHSSLFTLSAKDFSCLGVHYLGHAKGSIAVPLITVLNKVVVAVNKGIETSHLYVLETDEKGVLGEASATRRLSGLVNTNMFSAGRRLVVLTSSGQIIVSEINDGTNGDTLTPLASRDADGNSLLARYGLFHDGRVWSAGAQLNKMAILPTGNRLPMQNIDKTFQGDVFVHPLQVTGVGLIHVRRPSNAAGAVVAAMELGSGQAFWETHLAMPPAGAPAVDSKGLKIAALTSSGVAYQFDRDALRQRVQNQATHLPRSNKALAPLTTSADLGQGRLVAGAPGNKQMLHYLPEKSDQGLRAIELISPLSTSPVAWGNHFVAPTNLGQVFLYGSDDGKQIGVPFQPPISPGEQYHWLTPTTYGKGEDSRLLISDGREKIYLIAKATAPQVHLRAEAEAAVGTSPLNTRLAAMENIVCSGTKSGELARFQLPNLTPLEPLAISAQIVWGPYSAGNHILCSTDTEELICLDGQAEIAWRQPLSHGQPTGVPLANESALFIAWKSGKLSQLSAEDGTEKGVLELGRSVVAGPMALGKRLILSTSDGTLIVVNRP